MKSQTTHSKTVSQSKSSAKGHSQRSGNEGAFFNSVQLKSAFESEGTAPDLQSEAIGSGFQADAGSAFFPKESSASFFTGNPFFQAKLTVGKPNDKYEREADATADRVVSEISNVESPATSPSEISAVSTPTTTNIQSKCSECEQEEQQVEESQAEAPEVQQMAAFDPPPDDQSPNVQASGLPFLQRSHASEEEDDTAPLQRKASQTAKSSGNSIESQLSSSKGGGSPLPEKTRGKMEGAMGADFSGVRIHTGAQANQMSQSLGAQAFTHGNDIYFNQNKYNPHSSEGQHLLAHELTHTVQQGASIQMKVLISTGAVGPQASLSDILDWIADYIDDIPGYTLFTFILGYDPIRQQDVERDAQNLVRGLMGLVPFGNQIYEALVARGILQDAFTWIEDQLSSLNLSTERIFNLLRELWDEMGVGGAIVSFVTGDLVNSIVRKFQPVINDVENFASSLIDQVMSMIKEALISVAEPLLEENKAWSLIKKIIKYDPLRDEEVQATTVEILEDFLLLIGREQELEQMKERGTLQETADWLDTQVGTFMSLLGELRGLITSAWDAIQPENLPNIVENLQGLANQAFGFLQRVWDFASTVAIKVLELIKDALLGWLRSFATDIPGYHLLTVILGKDIFTNEIVERNVTNIIRGFMGLLPGGEEQFQQMQETGAIPRAAQRIESLMVELGISWDSVVALFTNLWNSFSIDDLLDPISAFQRIVDQFGEPIARLFEFVIEVIMIVIELIMEIMNFPIDLIQRIIANAMAAFNDIMNDPIGFLMNMLEAVKLGFTNFFDNILEHLMNGLKDWFFGQLEDAGITPPQDLSLESVLDLVLQIFGISMDQIWAKLADRIGQENVDRIRGAIDKLVGIWNFVKDVQERGIVAIWEYIQGQISNLWNMLLEKAIAWISETVIARVVTKLLSMLDPTGIMAVVNSFIAFFNAVQSAIEYIREILEIVDDYVSTIAAVARGDIQPGAEKMEQGFANAIPVAIGFLANQVGLGNLASRIAEIISDIRGVVDNALDWLIDQAVNMGQSILSSLGMGEDPSEEGGLGAVKSDLDAEEGQYLTNGAITEEEANQVAEAVAGRNESLVQTINVINGGDTLDYDIVQRTPDKSTPNENSDSVGLARLQQMRNTLTGEFTRSEYENAFEDPLTTSTANKDLKLGQDRDILDKLGGGSATKYLFVSMNREEIVEMGTRETLANGRGNSELNKDDGFNLEDLQTFLVNLTTLPSSSDVVNLEIVGDIIDNLVTEKEVVRDEDNDYLFTFSEVPAQRELPEAWKTAASGSGRSASADNIRWKYYLTGASPSWGEAERLTQERDLGLVETAIDNLESGVQSRISTGQMEWAQLRTNEIVPDEDYKNAANSGGKDHYLGLRRAVDHEPAMATQWKSQGYNQAWSTRQTYATSVDNTLTYILYEANQSKLAGGDQYVQKWWVGTEFSGPGQSKGPQWADENTMFENMKNYQP